MFIPWEGVQGGQKKTETTYLWQKMKHVIDDGKTPKVERQDWLEINERAAASVHPDYGIMCFNLLAACYSQLSFDFQCCWASEAHEEKELHCR